MEQILIAYCLVNLLVSYSCPYRCIPKGVTLGLVDHSDRFYGV